MCHRLFSSSPAATDFSLARERDGECTVHLLLLHKFNDRCTMYTWEGRERPPDRAEGLQFSHIEPKLFEPFCELEQNEKHIWYPLKVA